MASGTKLGRFEILSKLGEGGMGEVYLALDTRLDRKVALKTLPAELASNQDRMRRFTQEAKAAAALNHPNIAHIYEIGEAEGVHFIAMEFVDGKTLGECIHRDGTDLKKLLRYLQQVAEGLAKAHAAGIVHRDLKPDNIMIARDGYAKILDFGLAKLIEPQQTRSRDGSDSGVATAILPQHSTPGTVLGTVGYMSPEQARGRVDEIDHRSDIFSFGCILFEAATQRKPFEGSDMLDSLHNIVHAPTPSLKEINPTAPDDLQRILRRCLAKDSDRRYQSIKEVAIELEELRQELKAISDSHDSVHHTASSPGVTPISDPGVRTGISSPSTATIAAAPSTVSSSEFIAAKIKTHKKTFAVVLIAGALLVVVGILKLAGVGFGLGRLFDRKASPIAQLQQMKFTRIPVSGDVGWALISPDGKFIARVVREKTRTSLRLRQVGGVAEREIVPPTENYFVGGVTFAPDGSNIYYVTGEPSKVFRSLYRVSVLGGDPQKLIDDVDTGIAISPDGKRFGFRRHMPQTSEDRLIVVNEDGTNEQVIATRQAPAAFGKPEWGPDGQFLAYPILDRDEEGEYTILEATAVTDSSTKASPAARWRFINSIEWLPDGKGLIVTGKTSSAPAEDRGQIWHVPFPEGEPQKITNDANNYWGLSLTADARTALVMQSDVSSNVWVAPSSDLRRVQQITNTNSQIGELVWTADGQIIYATTTSGRFLDLWIMKSDGTGKRQLTFTADRHELQPKLSTDGRHIVFVTVNQTGLRSIWRMNVDGGGAKEVVRNVSSFAEPEFSPDSQWVFYSSRDETGSPSFWKVAFDGGEPVKVRDKTPCRISPDGKWFACVHREPVADATPKILIVPAAGGDSVRALEWPKNTNAFFWSPDGQALDFIADREGTHNIWRMSITGGVEQKLTDWEGAGQAWAFAWSRDGKQLAVTRDTRKDELILIQNFR